MDTSKIRPGDVAVFASPMAGVDDDQRETLVKTIQDWLPGVEVRMVWLDGAGLTLTLVAVFTP